MEKAFADYRVVQPDLAVTRVRYEEFHERLEAAGSAEDCLELIADWDGVVCEFKEWSSLTYIRFHQDTTNAAYKAEKER